MTADTGIIPALHHSDCGGWIFANRESSRRLLVLPKRLAYLLVTLTVCHRRHKRHSLSFRYQASW